MSKEEEVVSGTEEEEFNVEETRERARKLEAEGKFEEAMSLYCDIINSLVEEQSEAPTLEAAEPYLDYGRCMLLYSRVCFNEFGGLIAKKAMNKSLKAKAKELEAPLLSKAKGKIIDETVSDDEDEEFDGVDIQASFTEAWEHLESARYLITTHNGPPELFIKCLYWTAQAALELDDSPTAVEDFKKAAEVVRSQEKVDLRFLAELETLIGLSLQYDEKMEESAVHFAETHKILTELLSSMKREDNPTAYDEIESVRNEAALKIEDTAAPKVDVKSELEGFTSGFQKPMSSNSPIKDLGVFGRGAKGTPRLAKTPTKRKAEDDGQAPEKKTKL